MGISISRKSIVCGIFFLSSMSFATELSRSMSEAEVKDVASLLTTGSAHRAWTAHSVPNTGLGLSLGMETTFIPRGNIMDKGNGEAVVPRIIPVPRLWGSWDFPSDIFISFSLAPGSVFGGIAAYGLGVQWTFMRNPETAFNFSALFDYTYSDSFGDIKAHTSALALQISKDLVIWQPYGGLGFIAPNATVNPAIVKSGVFVGPYTLTKAHIYAGFRLDFLAKLSFQMDFFNANPSVAILLSHTF